MTLPIDLLRLGELLPGVVGVLTPDVADGPLADLLPVLLTIALGSLAGGLTNTVAVWMLFHPYEPPRIAGWRIPFLHGAIPKNQPRLAAAIGKTVGGRLLTPEDFQRIFARPEFREAFDQRLEGFLTAALEVERGSVRSLLPPDTVPQVESLLSEVADVAAERFIAYVESPEFEREVEARARDIVATMGDRPLGDLVTPAREAALVEALDQWLQEMADSEGFRSAVDDYLDRAVQRLLEPGRTFGEVLPEGLSGALEKAVGAYLPLAIQRLGRILEDPAARARFEGLIHDLLQRVLRDLRFHQRVVARVLITEETVERVLDAIEEEGAESISEMLRDPTVQDAMAHGIHHAVADFLKRPVASVLGEADSETVVSARTTVRGWLMGLAEDPATRAFLVEKFRSALDRTAERRWGEVFQRLPPERLTEWTVSAVRSEAALGFYRDGARRVLLGALDRPIGRPDQWLPGGARQRLQAELSEPLWKALQAQVPDLVERLEVARRVEEKVRQYPTPEIEDLVRRVTERELRLIIRLGYFLGAVIGVIVVGVNALLG